VLWGDKRLPAAESAVAIQDESARGKKQN